MATLATFLTLLPLLVTAAVFPANATQHIVGGSGSWSIPAFNNVNYTQWSNQSMFIAGDSLLFKYNSSVHNVDQVTPEDYGSCNDDTPLAHYTDGNTMIPLNSTGTFYFICGAPGHCAAGQKVSVMVVDPMEAPVPSSSSSSSPLQSPSPTPISQPTPASSVPIPPTAPSPAQSPTSPSPFQSPLASPKRAPTPFLSANAPSPTPTTSPHGVHSAAAAAAHKIDSLTSLTWQLLPVYIALIL